MIVIKRIISVVCALVLSLSFTVIPTFAADNVRYVEVLPECQLTFDNGFFCITEPFSLTIGEAYSVELNGTEYTVTAIDAGVFDADFTGFAALFNDGTDLSTEDGLPFLILAAHVGDGIYGMVETADGVTELTVSIYQVVEISALESSGVFTGVTDMVDSSIGWVGSFVDGVIQSPLLLLFVLTAFASLGISIIALIKKK